VAHKSVTEGEADLPRKTNLIQRAGRWYFNRAYPKDLWPIIGKAPFRMALQTDSLEMAQRRRPDAERRYFAAIDAARASQAAKAPMQLSEIEATGIAARWFRQEFESRIEDIESNRGISFDLDAALDEIVEYESEARQAVAEDDLIVVRQLAMRLVENEGFEVARGAPAFKALQRVLLRGRRELALLQKSRLLGDYSVKPSDPFFANALTALTEAPQRTIGDLIEAHKADKVAKRSPSTQASYEPVWRLLKDVLGANRPLSSVSREEGRLLFETVKVLPKGVGKSRELRGLKIPEAVEKGRSLGLPTIAPKTVNAVYMGLLKTIFTWAVREQWITANPLAGLLVDEEVADEDKRDPFTMDQLRKVFALAPWSPRNESPRGKPLHFWGPLIALFHGMRRGEIAQLDASAITEVEGIPVILIRGGHGKRLKTANARRMLPVHPELIRMGFLAYAKRQKDAGEGKLFSGETPNSRGQWGDGFSDWFTRVIQNEGLKGARLGLHSFRHNWQDRAREAGLHGTAIGQELAGRAKGGDSSNNYGSGFSTAALAEASSRIAYPELDLSHLYVAD
jgi:integrase